MIAMPMRIFAWLLGMLPAAVVGKQRINAVLNDPDTFVYGRHDGSGSGGATTTAQGVSYLHPETRFSNLGDEPIEAISRRRRVPSRLLSSCPRCRPGTPASPPHGPFPG